LTLDDECALLSKAAYGTGALPPGWAAVRTITRRSGLQATLYYNAAKNQYVLAFKGTSQFEDWRANSQQAYTLTQQYQDAVDLARDMSHQYKNALTFTGHSLGGGLASAAALETGRNAITFNAAGISPNTATIYGWDLNAPNTNVRSYYIPGEVLTNVQRNIAGWIRLKRPGTQIALPVPSGGKLKLHGMDSVLSAMGL
jgi:predicted alpha/beta-fold hydrolase